MRLRAREYRDESGAEARLLRERLGLGRYRKTAKRDSEERRLLLELALRRMEEAEKDDFLPVGARRRKIRLA